MYPLVTVPGQILMVLRIMIFVKDTCMQHNLHMEYIQSMWLICEKYCYLYDTVSLSTIQIYISLLRCERTQTVTTL